MTFYDSSIFISTGLTLNFENEYKDQQNINSACFRHTKNLSAGDDALKENNNKSDVFNNFL